MLKILIVEVNQRVQKKFDSLNCHIGDEMKYCHYSVDETSFQTAWTTDMSGFRPATKSSFMTALQKIDYILIKSRYHAYPSDVRYVCVGLLRCEWK